MPAKLTVIVPMFNAAQTVAAALDSIIAQTFTDWECVVVDDGSTDGGPTIVRAYIERDERFRMVTQPNRGLPGARNTGLEEGLRSGSEFMHFLDSDDWMHPRAYEWMVPAAAKLGGAYGGYELCGPDNRPLGRQSAISAPVVGLDEQLEWNRTATHAHLFAASMIGDCRFDENLRVVEDYDLWLRLAIRGERWQAVERIVCGYRLRPDSMSKKFGAMAECIEEAVRKAFREAAAMGWAGKIDLSERRLTRICGNNAMLYATMEALLDPAPAKDRAAALMRSRLRPERFTPAAAAQHASTALLFGACTAPDLNGRTESSWLAALMHWWERCVKEGWMGPDNPELALVELSRKVVHPNAICVSMLDAARGDSGRNAGAASATGAPALVGIVGLEKNGRRLARHAAGRSMRVLAVDDFSPEPEVELLEELPGVRVERGGAKRDAKSEPAVWLTGLMGPEAGAMVQRVAAGAGAKAAVSARRVELWQSHRERIGERNLGRMRAALGTGATDGRGLARI